MSRVLGLGYPPRLAGGAALLIGVVLLSVGLQQGWTTRAFVASAMRAEGEVIECGVAPVFRFADEQGREHAVRSSYPSDPPRYRMGDRVTVLYAAAAPERAVLDDGSLWLTPMILGLVGGAFALAGTVLVVWGPRLARAVTPQLASTWQPSWKL